MKVGKRRSFLKVMTFKPFLSAVDDSDWNIDIKNQFNLMSNALKEWRKDTKDVSTDHPYGTEWDIFMLGHCLEVMFELMVRDVSTKSRNHISFTPIPPSKVGPDPIAKLPRTSMSQTVIEFSIELTIPCARWLTQQRAWAPSDYSTE
jgi:hypothetical protein